MRNTVEERKRRARGVWMARDVVEIVAIVAAGIWALLHVRVRKPDQAVVRRSGLNFVVTMEKLGQRGPLIGVRLHTEIHNVGTVQANLVGLLYWVVGKRVEPTDVPRKPIVTHDSAVLKAFYREGRGVPVFGLAYLTQVGDVRSEDRTEIAPGGVLSRDSYSSCPLGASTISRRTSARASPKSTAPPRRRSHSNQQAIPVFNVTPDRPTSRKTLRFRANWT